MSNMPVFLVGYPVFSKLKDWKDRSTAYATNRSWQIKSYSDYKVSCTLNWSLKGQVAGLDRYALSPEEAVWSCLEEFTRLENMFQGE